MVLCMYSKNILCAMTDRVFFNPEPFQSNLCIICTCAINWKIYCPFLIDELLLQKLPVTNVISPRLQLKFVYSEKATKFCEISTLLLSTVHTDKNKVEISQNFVAFSEYMNFKMVIFVVFENGILWKWFDFAWFPCHKNLTSIDFFDISIKYTHNKIKLFFPQS